MKTAWFFLFMSVILLGLFGAAIGQYLAHIGTDYGIGSLYWAEVFFLLFFPSALLSIGSLLLTGK
jgi:hypothetical protein